MRGTPETHYVLSGGYSVAYQVFGDGPADVMYLSPYFSQVDVQWFVPPIRRFLEAMGRFSRVIVTDPRGVGASDRLSVARVATLEERVEDLLAVMSVTASREVVVFGSQETVFVAMLAAATHPDRFISMVLFSASASWVKSEDLPHEWSPERWEAEKQLAAQATSTRLWTRQYVRQALPSLAGDPEVTELIGVLGRATASPGTVMGEIDRYRDLDLRDLVPSIHVPGLVLHRPEEAITSTVSARWLADHLPDARYVELPGRDSLPWGDDADAVLAEVEEFVTGGRREEPAPDRSVTTVLFTDIVDSTIRAAALGDDAWTKLLAAHHAQVRSCLREHGGREVDFSGDGVFAVFDGPARAVLCASTLIQELGALGLQIRAGVHTGEVSTEGAKVAGIAVHIGARVSALAETSEVLVTSTVRDLVAGSALRFEDRGTHQLKGIPEPWQLYAVTDTGTATAGTGS